MTESAQQRADQRPRKKKDGKHRKAGRFGARLRPGTEDTIATMLDLMGSGVLRRQELYRGYEVAVANRKRSIAEWKASEAVRAKIPLCPTELRSLRKRALDEAITAARERMVATVRPDKAEETRAELIEYLRRTRKRMAGHGSAQAAQAGVQAVMAEAKLTGLVIDKVESKNEHGFPGLTDADRAALAPFLASLKGGAGTERGTSA